MCGMVSFLLEGGIFIHIDIYIFCLYFQNEMMGEKHRLTKWKLELFE